MCWYAYLKFSTFSVPHFAFFPRALAWNWTKADKTKRNEGNKRTKKKINNWEKRNHEKIFWQGKKWKKDAASPPPPPSPSHITTEQRQQQQQAILTTYTHFVSSFRNFSHFPLHSSLLSECVCVWFFSSLVIFFSVFKERTHFSCYLRNLYGHTHSGPSARFSLVRTAATVAVAAVATTAPHHAKQRQTLRYSIAGSASLDLFLTNCHPITASLNGLAVFLWFFSFLLLVFALILFVAQKFSSLRYLHDTATNGYLHFSEKFSTSFGQFRFFFVCAFIGKVFAWMRVRRFSWKVTNERSIQIHWIEQHVYEMHISMALHRPLCWMSETKRRHRTNSWMVNPHRIETIIARFTLSCLTAPSGFVAFILIALLPTNKGNINCFSILHFCLLWRRLKNTKYKRHKNAFPAFFLRRCCLLYIIIFAFVFHFSFKIHRVYWFILSSGFKYCTVVNAQKENKNESQQFESRNSTYNAVQKSAHFKRPENARIGTMKWTWNRKRRVKEAKMVSSYAFIVLAAFFFSLLLALPLPMRLLLLYP